MNQQEVREPRVPPQNIEAEKSVLGGMLIDARAAGRAFERLKPPDFYLERHQDLFLAMKQLSEAGTPLDAITLVDELDRRGVLQMAGGFTYITDLTLFTPSAANIEQYISIVEEKSALRELIRAGNDIIDNAYDSETEWGATLAQAEKRVFDIALKKASRSLLPIKGELDGVYSQISDWMENRGKMSGVPSGFYDLDAKLNGLQKSDLIIIAGRPAMGKTTFAVNIAQHASTREGRHVAIFSLEMSREQLVLRMLCSEAEVDMSKVRGGEIGVMELEKLANAMLPLARANVYVDDTAGISVGEVQSKCRRLKLEQGLDLVVIDYLQLMQSSTKSENRQQEISQLTRALKIMARDLDVPVIVLAQLSRAPEQRANHRPMMSDLRESGSIEQDADIILMLYREAVYAEAEGEAADNTAEVIIAKHRNGPTGVVNVQWWGEFTKFKNPAYREQ